MFQKHKRITALILVITLMLTSMPLSAFAQEGQAERAGRFRDVPEDAWYYEDVASAAQAGIFSGIGGGRFNPDGYMTRAMAVTVIGHLDKVDPDKYQGLGGFRDVPYGAWYSPYVVWAAENHIAAGVGGNRFSPEGKVTREAFAAMLVRYLDYAGVTPQQVSGVKLPEDISAASSWARDSVITLWSAGLMKGNNGKVDPKGTVSRAQGAALLVRVMEYLEEQAATEKTPTSLTHNAAVENEVEPDFSIAIVSSALDLSAANIMGLISAYDGSDGILCISHDAVDNVTINGKQVDSPIISLFPVGDKAPTIGSDDIGSVTGSFSYAPNNREEAP